MKELRYTSELNMNSRKTRIFSHRLSLSSGTCSTFITCFNNATDKQYMIKWEGKCFEDRVKLPGDERK